jgi:hypothetical protein
MPEPFALGSLSPRHRLPYLRPGQSQKEFLVNEALARIDALVQATVLTERTDPPTQPEPGDAYLVAVAATGGWEGQDGAIAIYQGSGWLFQAPIDGVSVLRLDTRQIGYYSNGWIVASEPAEPSGGTTIDSEARVAISALITALRHSGIFPSA